MLDPLGLYEYRVALHVHSRYSDGSGSPEEIIAEANRAGLDVLWLTDHDGREAARHPGSGYYGHLLFLVGAEITPPTNHYLAFGPVEPPPATLPFQEIINRVRDQGGLGFIAHPEDAGNATAHLPSYRWTDRAVEGFTGLEIWNHISDWSRQIHHIPGGIWAALHPFSGMVEAWPASLALWDALGQHRPVVGIGGTDAHAARVGFGPLSLTLFAYRKSFQTIRTHLYTTAPLSTDWRWAEAQLLEALQAGRAAVVNAARGGETGFRLWARSSDGNQAAMGSVILAQKSWRLQGLSPVLASWRVIRDGRIVQQMTGTVLDAAVTEPGVWRVELWRPGGAWLYSNPLYVR